MTEAIPNPATSILETWAALIAVSLGIFIITLDGTMIPVAIGSIVDDLRIRVGFVQGAMALHALVMASAYLAAGKLADRSPDVQPACPPARRPGTNRARLSVSHNCP